MKTAQPQRVIRWSESPAAPGKPGRPVPREDYVGAGTRQYSARPRPDIVLEPTAYAAMSPLRQRLIADGIIVPRSAPLDDEPPAPRPRPKPQQERKG